MWLAAQQLSAQPIIDRDLIETHGLQFEFSSAAVEEALHVYMSDSLMCGYADGVRMRSGMSYTKTFSTAVEAYNDHFMATVYYEAKGEFDDEQFESLRDFRLDGSGELFFIDDRRYTRRTLSVDDIPLPEGIQQDDGIAIFSTPNPNHPEFIPDSDRIVWKHQTFLVSDEDAEILEVNAYLLNKGEWMLRQSFTGKAINKMFETKKGRLLAKDTLVYRENWRVDNATRSGYNFWHVKVKTNDGEIRQAYDILYTSGRMQDGTQVLPLMVDTSSIQWTGRAGDSDYSLTDTIPGMSGTLIWNEGAVQGGQLTIAIATLEHEIETLRNHLLSKDFFHADKYPEIRLDVMDATMIEGTAQLTCDLSLRGVTQAETFKCSMSETKESITLTGTLTLDRTAYGMTYASSKAPDDNYSIADEISIDIELRFQKDYPGSNPWNTINP